MNDALRFRVWDKIFSQYWTEEVIKENASWLLFPDNNNINDIKIERYIGNKDNKEKPIYEGDIVKTRYGNGVVYYRKDGCFAIRNDNYIVAKDGICPFDISISHLLRNKEVFEIIGNINETPELLKGD